MTNEDRGSASVAAEAKQALRVRLRATRSKRSPAETQTASLGIATNAMNLVRGLSTSFVAAYASYGSEPPTTQLITELHGADVQVLLPIVRKDRELDWAIFEGFDELAPGAQGIPEPLGEQLGLSGIQQAALIFVPALAVDAAGHRIGQGMGCYDRALARYPAGVVVAIVFDDEVLEGDNAIPVEPHDRAINAVLTPSRVKWFE
jgi:5-formyltetrahydrofolate cyclo-ligase